MTLKPDVVLSLEGVSKKFCRNLKRSMLYGATDFLKDSIGLAPPQEKTLRPSEFWALSDISFELKRGSTVGVIGRNGSGKSTLLRLIAGILPPDHGKITLRGRVGALISLGAGFHPHLSGRDNIFMNGAILGMSRSDITKKLDSIIDFAELGEFIDAPVSTYSSGMTVRLGFSIASHGEPDILLVDEVLAVGDLRFALKCHRKMADYRKNGGSTLMVTHSNQAIRNICKEALWLEKGSVRAEGEVHEVCNQYELETSRNLGDAPQETGQNLQYDETARITSVDFLDALKVSARPQEGSKTEDPVVDADNPFRIRIHYKMTRTVSNPVFVVNVQTMENVVAFSNYSTFDGYKPAMLSGNGSIDFSIPRLGLKPGRYLVTVLLSENEVGNTLDQHENLYSFVVTSNSVSYGLVNPRPTWTVTSNSNSI